MAAGGIGGPTLWALQEALIQEAAYFRGRGGVVTLADGKSIKLQAVVGAGL